MFLTSEESRNSMNSFESDESLYSKDLMSTKGEKSSAQLNQQRPKRKREKLDHLSNEEKILRRKMKNRISAQSARDRKKMKMNDLQDQLAALSEERVQMLKENELLKKRMKVLEKENNDLKNRLVNFSSSSDDENGSITNSMNSEMSSTTTADNTVSSSVTIDQSPRFVLDDNQFAINSAEIFNNGQQSRQVNCLSLNTDQQTLMRQQLKNAFIVPLMIYFLMTSLIRLSVRKMISNQTAEKQLTLIFGASSYSTQPNNLVIYSQANHLINPILIKKSISEQLIVISLEMLKYLQNSIPII